VVHTLGPAGVDASDVRECLLLVKSTARNGQGSAFGVGRSCTDHLKLVEPAAASKRDRPGLFAPAFLHNPIEIAVDVDPAQQWTLGNRDCVYRAHSE